MKFGQEQSDETLRHTVVAVVFDRQSGMFLCQHWPEYNGLTCLLSGGVESDEDVDQAVSREITEETGYDDFTVLGTLGGGIEMHYVKANGQRYLKHITPYLVVLNSRNDRGHAREADEKFDNMFKAPEDIEAMMRSYEAITKSSLEDHREILRRGVEYLKSVSNDI